MLRAIRLLVTVWLGLLALAGTAYAQKPDTTAKPDTAVRRGTIARPDTTARDTLAKPHPDTAGIYTTPPIVVPRNTAGMKILISVEKRWLWLVQDKDTLMSVPVAVGMGEEFNFASRKWFFATPKGKHSIVEKVKDPVWTVPDWQYYEEASGKGLQVVHTKRDEKYPVHDDSYVKYLEVRGDSLGWVNQNDVFYAPDGEHYIEYDGKVYIPPLSSAQRQIRDALGPRALHFDDDGDMIHGTNDFDANSIGRAVSHGCVRMDNDSLLKLYDLVPLRAPVYIF